MKLIQKGGFSRFLQEDASQDCNNLEVLVRFRSDVPTVLLKTLDSGAAGAHDPERLHSLRGGLENYSTEWFVDFHSCPSTDYTGALVENCLVLHNAADGSRLQQTQRGRPLSFGTDVFSALAPHQFWQYEFQVESGNRVALSNAATGTVILATNAGNGPQIGYGIPGYPLDDRFWNLEVAEYLCLD